MQSYRNKIFWLIGFTTLIRICLSFTTELGNVEVYYWSWSVSPQLNYIDHPPLVAWMISATTLGQSFVNEFTVRFGSIIAAAICTWLCYETGKRVRNEKAGWYAALCYSSCIFTSAVAGTNVLPDSPQLIFWLVSLLLMLKLAALSPDQPKVGKYWLLLGVTSGLCMMCKVHGAAIWFGILLYCALYERGFFSRIYVYLALAITLIIISPMIIWNMDHDWYTWKFQSTRFMITSGSIDLKRFLTQIIGVIFTIGPIHFYLIWRCIYLICRGRFPLSGNQVKIILCCGLPLIIFLFIVSFFREVYYHWPGPAYAGLLILPAVYMAENAKNTNRNFPGVLIWSAAYCLSVMALQPLMVNYLPGTTSTEKEGIHTGTDDATVDMIGWKNTGEQYEKLYRKRVRDGSVKKTIPIVVTDWTPAAAIDFYLARRSGQQVLGIGSLDSLHQYYLMNSGKRMLLRGDDVFYIVPSNHLNLTTVTKLTNHFDSAINILSVPTYRNGLLCKETYIFLLKNYDGHIVL